MVARESVGGINMSIRLALADAAKNCEECGAMAVVMLKTSGIQYEGKLKRERVLESQHMELDHGGWVTIDTEEVAAVEAKPGVRA